MNLHSRFAWVRAAGLISVLGLVACDGGSADTKADAKKAEPAKAPVEVKAVEPAKVETKTPTPTDVKTGETAGDTKPADAAGGDPTKAGDTKAGDTKAGDTKAGDAAGDAAKAAIGKPLYEAKCKVCHGLDGKGTEAQKKNKIPDMTVADWQSKHDNAAVVRAITNGIDGTKMKAFKDKLKPEEIDAVAVYVKTLK